MLPDSPISTSQSITRIGTDHALDSNFPQVSSGNGSFDKDSLESLLAKLNDAELRLLRDRLSGVQARVYAACAIRTFFAQVSRDALEELVESLD